MMIDMVLGIIAVTFAVAMFAVVVVLCIDDTETFRAIDEKIARIIKGEDDENEEYSQLMSAASRSKGHWIKAKDKPHTWVCSKCGVKNTHAICMDKICDNYCPHCGAYMKGEE